MAVRHASSTWNGGLKDGKGTMNMQSGAYEGQYSFSSRFEEGTGTNPEELIAAAHSGCFSMALSGQLEKNGFSPKRVKTKADVHLTKGDEGFSISKIMLHTEADVPEITEEKFQELANNAKKGCPVSRALSAVNIEMEARLVK